MAVDFTTAQRYQIAASVVTAYPFTLACWFWCDSLAANRTLIDLGSTTANNGQRIFAGAASFNAESTEAGAANSAVTTVAPSVNTWHHGCGVYDSATDRRAFLDGGNKGTATASRTFSATIDRTTLCARLRTNAIAQQQDGRLAEVCVWNASLTDAEVASLATGIRPSLIRPSSLVLYVPMIREVLDLARNNVLTVTGTPTVIEHPKRIA